VAPDPGAPQRAFDPYSETFFEDPWETYRWMREQAPVYHHPDLDFFAVSRYEDCVEVHRDFRTYTSTRGVTLDQLRNASFGAVVEQTGSIIMMDPPRHERLRKLVNRAFTARRIAGWEPVARRVICGFLDELTGRESFDVVGDVSGPFPVEVISEILGVPSADRQQLRHWADALLEREVGNPFPPASAMEAAVAFFTYMHELVVDRRAHPGTAMIDDLIAAEVETADGGREQLDDLEVSYFIALLTAAGAETVTKLVGNGVMTFAEHPDQLAKLQADPALVSGAVEEVLRWRAPSVTIPAGHPVLIVTGAANRDPRAYDEPDRFDIERVPPMPISFGHGIHYCIGAHLARLEGEIAFTELYRRWPDLEVDLDAIRYVHMTNVAGPSSVPVHV
jgi:cytochrome P450